MSFHNDMFKRLSEIQKAALEELVMSDEYPTVLKLQYGGRIYRFKFHELGASVYVERQPDGENMRFDLMDYPVVIYNELDKVFVFESLVRLIQDYEHGSE